MDGDYVLELNGWREDLFTPVGKTVGRCGDVDGDGLNDIVFGTWGRSNYNAGEVVIIGGSDEWVAGIKHNNNPIGKVMDFRITGLNPNPFNNVLKIDIELTRKTGYRLAIYDLHGNKIELIADAKKRKGAYQYLWNGKEHSAGIYFVSLINTEGLKDVRKVVLLK